MAAIYWWADSAPLDVAAVVILTTLLINTQSIAANSLMTSLAFGVVPTLALIIFPFTNGFQDVAVIAVLTTVAMALSFLVINLRQSVVSSDALRKAQATLIARQIELEAETQRADAANRAKSAFLAVMSHELRTPMNGVLGMAQALRHTTLDERQKSYVDMLMRSGDGLMTILNDILDLSKIEAGKLEIETIPMDLPDLASRVHELWIEAASAKGVRLLNEIDPLMPTWVAGDPTRLRQVMTNLVSNALKFTAAGGEVKLLVQGAMADDGHTRVRISVSDTGIGMTADQVAGLFQAFAQADSTTTRKFGGTGLGLAISKQLVDLMGGKIIVRSQPGEGSTFVVALTLALAKPQVPSQPKESPDITGARLLVVDDNPINLKVAQAILEAVGATVIVAGNGLAALDILKTADFDAVLMDIHMPRMGGVETLARIRSGDGGDPAVPVIALSADAMDGVDEDLKAQGFDAVQPKPIQRLALIGAIAGARAGRRATKNVPYRPRSS
jgi:signal transduction histidine kinase